ncbi:hypothetical protein PV08_01071 [Exophiala spinifera]|uniref:Uncharacterized protein n=1 Tax=Exophiala spinifera TaxID=91928 RepID=A0A0D1YYZ5_9EURO|nr:uncharacterized protein PV08_01071 [Exophiala spinifera]KIW20496.1 hypothetical protein PV08_01071 [Exophiala spinifera]
MKYSTIDPKVYGIKITSKPQTSINGDGRQQNSGQKASGEANHKSSSAQPASVSSVPLHTASNTSQSVAQLVQPTRNDEVTSSTAASASSMATSTLSSTVSPHPTTREPATINQQAKLGAREQRLAENRKRRRRDNIAAEVGHEVDSDGEREYWEAISRRHAAEEARRQALSPEARRQEDIESSAEVLRNHIKPKLILDHFSCVRLRHYPLFLLQTAPDSRNGARCRQRHCTDRIDPGKYRIAVSPGLWDSRGPDYYHVKCFEELLDLSSPHYVARFEPDRQKHIPDHGAQCILEEYISRWKLRIKQTPHHEDPQPSPGVEHLLLDSSSTQKDSAMAKEDASTTEQQVPSSKIRTEPAAPEQIPTSRNESPIPTPPTSGAAAQSVSASNQTTENDVWNIGDSLWAQVRQAEADASERYNRISDMFLMVDDSKDLGSTSTDRDCTWHITRYLLPDDDPDYDERHALSEALADWDVDIILANTDMSELTEAGRAAKEALGELTMKRIKKYQFRARRRGRPVPSKTVKTLYDVRNSMLFDKNAIQVLRNSIDCIYNITSTFHQIGQIGQEARQPTADHMLQLNFWHRNIIAHINRLNDRICDLLSRFKGTESAVMRMLSLRDSRALNLHTQEIAIIARNSESSGNEMQEMAKRMEKDARLMKFLAEVTAFFLPLTAVASVFSMDFFSVSETSRGIVPSLDKLKYSWLYWAFALPVSGFVCIVWFRKRFTIESNSTTAMQEIENLDSSTFTATSQRSDTKKRARQLWEQLKNIAMKSIHKGEDVPQDKALLLM